MTERTIRHLAVELAGEFYDVVRSAEKAGEKVQIRRASTGRAIQQIDPTAFGKTFPTVKDYLEGRKHGTMRHLPNGQVFWVDHVPPDKHPARCTRCGQVCWEDTPGWMHWYDAARQKLVEMLTMPHISEEMKRSIADALIEDREKQLKSEKLQIKQPDITQRRNLRV